MSDTVTSVVFDAHMGAFPVSVIGIESRGSNVPRFPLSVAAPWVDLFDDPEMWVSRGNR